MCSLQHSSGSARHSSQARTRTNRALRPGWIIEPAVVGGGLADALVRLVVAMTERDAARGWRRMSALEERCKPIGIGPLVPVESRQNGSVATYERKQVTAYADNISVTGTLRFLKPAT